MHIRASILWDLVYKSKEPLESLLLLINSKRYVKVGYNTDIMQHFACLDINPITACSYDFLFNCTMGQAPDSVTTLTQNSISGLVHGACLCLGPPWTNLGFSLHMTVC